MKNKTLIYLAVGIGLVYLMTRKKKKKTAQVIEDSPIATAPTINSESLGDLQRNTAEAALATYERRGFPIDEGAKGVMIDFFTNVNNKQDLYDYQTIFSKKIDKFMDKIAAVEGEVNIDKFKDAYNELGVNVSFDKFKDLTKKFESYIMEKIMGSMSNSTSMNGWDY